MRTANTLPRQCQHSGRGACLYLHRPSEKPGVSSLLLKNAAREGGLVSLRWLSNEALCRHPFMCSAPELTDSDKPAGPASRDWVSTCRQGQHSCAIHRSGVFFSGSHTRWGGGWGTCRSEGPLETQYGLSRAIILRDDDWGAFEIFPPSVWS